MVDTTQTTTEKNSLKVIFVASSCVLTSFRVHGTSNVCRHWVSASLWYRQFVASTLRTTKLVNKLFAVTGFFNTQPFVAAPILGVTTALEEQRANGAEIDDGAINGIKVGLMGPLAGVGDPIFWGTVRPVFAALGAGIAMSGSLLGPLLFFILFNRCVWQPVTTA